MSVMYRRRPTAVQAWQFTEQPFEEWPSWLRMMISPADMIAVATSKILFIPESRSKFARLGDWLVVDPHSPKIRLVKKEVFERD